MRRVDEQSRSSGYVISVRIIANLGLTGSATTDPPKTSLSNLSWTPSQSTRIKCSINLGFFFASGCPNQWRSGRSLVDDNAVGAEVAVIPKGFAGDDVGIGESIGHADKVPGIVNPP